MNKETRGAAEERPSYKNTLNLLQTSFGMRANAVTREPELQSFWAEHGIDFKLGLTNKGPTFTLHDGPPYAMAPYTWATPLTRCSKTSSTSTKF